MGSPVEFPLTWCFPLRDPVEEHVGGVRGESSLRSCRSNKVLKEEWMLHAELVLLTAGHISILQQHHSPRLQPAGPSGGAMDCFPWPPLFPSLCGIIATPELAPLSSNQLVLPAPSELLFSSSAGASLGNHCRLILQHHPAVLICTFLPGQQRSWGDLVGSLRGNN